MFWAVNINYQKQIQRSCNSNEFQFSMIHLRDTAQYILTNLKLDSIVEG